METKSFKVSNIGCDGCVRTIKNELGEMAGVKQVDADVSTKMVTVQWDSPATWQKIVSTLREVEYAPDGENLITL